MHGDDATWYHLPVLPYAEVPRLDAHHVVKHELQVQPALHINLPRGENMHTNTQHLTERLLENLSVEL